MSQLPYFLSDFHHVLHQSVGTNFTLSFEIMVILDWTSPLKQVIIQSLHGNLHALNCSIVLDDNCKGEENNQE